MSNVLGTLFTDIANAIRNKTGTTTKMSPNDFPIQINNIVVSSGGSGNTAEGWDTFVEEQMVTPTYNSDWGCYCAQVPITDTHSLNTHSGTIFIVHIDGVSYPVGLGGVLATINKGQSNEMKISICAAGNYELITCAVGNPCEMLTNYGGNEPFAMIGNRGQIVELVFPNDTSHTIKVDYMPRYGTI